MQYKSAQELNPGLSGKRQMYYNHCVSHECFLFSVLVVIYLLFHSVHVALFKKP